MDKDLLLQAMDRRVSRRTYDYSNISESNLKLLKDYLNGLDKEVRIEFITSDTEGFSTFKKSYGLFKNVKDYFVLIGDKKDYPSITKSAYEAEKLVLYATSLGLGTCWIGGNFDDSKSIKLENNESILCTIAVGNIPEQLTKKEQFIHYMTHRNKRNIDSLVSTSDVELPEYFFDGLKGVAKAPSAMNKQPVRFSFEKGIIQASIPENSKTNCLDLGIALLHFELASKLTGTWDFNNRIFKVEENDHVI